MLPPNGLFLHSGLVLPPPSLPLLSLSSFSSFNAFHLSSMRPSRLRRQTALVVSRTLIASISIGE